MSETSPCKTAEISSDEIKDYDQYAMTSMRECSHLAAFSTNAAAACTALGSFAEKAKTMASCNQEVSCHSIPAMWSKSDHLGDIETDIPAVDAEEVRQSAVAQRNNAGLRSARCQHHTSPAAALNFPDRHGLAMTRAWGFSSRDFTSIGSP